MLECEELELVYKVEAYMSIMASYCFHKAQRTEVVT